MSRAHIGIDLDNTLVDYETVFAEVAPLCGLLPPGHALVGRAAIKAHLRAGPHGEEGWMRLQGQVYGRYIGKAPPCPGVEDFLRQVRMRGGRVSIVSHRTRLGHFDAARVDLHDAAKSWLTQHGVFDRARLGLAETDLHLAETREEKLARIAAIGCHAFVDDLAEVLVDPRFPAATRPVWFAPHSGDARGALAPLRSWPEVLQAVSDLL